MRAEKKQELLAHVRDVKTKRDKYTTDLSDIAQERSKENKRKLDLSRKKFLLAAHTLDYDVLIALVEVEDKA